jgi:hypothetical protein
VQELSLQNEHIRKVVGMFSTWGPSMSFHMELGNILILVIQAICRRKWSSFMTITRKMGGAQGVYQQVKRRLVPFPYFCLTFWDQDPSLSACCICDMNCVPLGLQNLFLVGVIWIIQLNWAPHGHLRGRYRGEHHETLRVFVMDVSTSRLMGFRICMKKFNPWKINLMAWQKSLEL